MRKEKQPTRTSEVDEAPVREDDEVELLVVVVEEEADDDDRRSDEVLYDWRLFIWCDWLL